MFCILFFEPIYINPDVTCLISLPRSTSGQAQGLDFFSGPGYCRQGYGDFPAELCLGAADPQYRVRGADLVSADGGPVAGDVRVLLHPAVCVAAGQEVDGG